MTSAGFSNPPNVKIIDDEPEKRAELGFEKYSNTIAEIIESSPAKFTVGIFGDWGIGKTTLMEMVWNKMKRDDKNILTVWFDAWRFEREENIAVVPFLRTVAIELERNQQRLANKNKTWIRVKNAFRSAFVTFLKSSKFSIGVSDLAGYELDFSKIVEAIENNALPETGSQVLYYEAIEYLRKAMEDLTKDNAESKIVVFIDDLDRCLPENALEVVESIKSLFDIPGFVFVMP